MRVLKEVLVLAALVLLFAFAARQLEGIDAGKIESDVPPFTRALKQLLGWGDRGEKAPEAPAPERAGPPGGAEPTAETAPATDAPPPAK